MYNVIEFSFLHYLNHSEKLRLSLLHGRGRCLLLLSLDVSPTIVATIFSSELMVVDVESR